jgi:hypothetical protein
MESYSLTHDPIIYKFLPLYSMPCPGSGVDDSLIACWSEPSGAVNSPKVEVNVTDQQNGWFPARSLGMAPGSNNFVLIAWRSPITGHLTLKGSFKAIETGGCGNGINWFVEKGQKTLSSGDGVTFKDFYLSRLFMKEGEVLYFIVDAKGEQSCDTTGLNLSIRKFDDH